MKNLLLLAASFLFSFNLLTVNAQKATWTKLFDGKTLNGWKQLGGNAIYTVEKGVIAGTTVPSTPNSFLVTEKEYGDFVLELEVLMPDTVTNSGIQIRSHFNPGANDGKGRVYGYQYELDASSRAWTGGIYDEGRRGWLYPLDLNAAAQKAYKRGVFNKVKIECIGNTIKTWINDVPASYLVDDADAKGFIALQVHGIGNAGDAGKKILWKNIRIQTGNLSPAPFPAGVFVVNNEPNTLTAFEKSNGWKLLFDGISSKGWRGAKILHFPEKGWKIADGNITVLSSKGEESANGGDIVTDDLYSAFDFSFEFRLSFGGNSGVKYFVTLSENNVGSALGLEYQVLDDKNHPDAKMGIAGNRTLSSLYDLIAAKKTDRIVKPVGEWNQGRIIVYPNNHVEHYLNGVKVLEYERGSQAFRERVAGSKFKNRPYFGEGKEGRLLLQDHGDNVSFRSLKIKVLK
ncbi:MAG TPA: DUF1080 domain-containing protein [Agriterribacter sp.]|nr:DUF1080 domain-containing protein [Agriterribacter sp.]HRQ50974.1 DUF1080 domain-containing protein [Agriterribacter sp.]